MPIANNFGGIVLCDDPSVACGDSSPCAGEPLVRCIAGGAGEDGDGTGRLPRRAFRALLAMTVVVVTVSGAVGAQVYGVRHGRVNDPPLQ